MNKVINLYNRQDYFEEINNVWYYVALNNSYEVSNEVAEVLDGIYDDCYVGEPIIWDLNRDLEYKDNRILRNWLGMR